MKEITLKLKAALVLLLITIATAGAADWSGTLPVMHINTIGGMPITSKETYVKATYYVDALGIDGYKNVASASLPDTMQIRGRGNYTWTGFDKKPYRIKLDNKTALLGMNKSKHFVLLAHADDDLAFLRNTLGFQLSRMLGLAWTPAQEPVEVVLNGKYIGLYMLTENIRIDKTRVNIVEQADEETDPEKITGGWLVEIDNYQNDPHVSVDGMTITYHTPEVLSSQQETYLYDQFHDIHTKSYKKDAASTEWETILDKDDLVRFYIVQEILDNQEAFHGSCYLHKDLNEERWHFGPVWDFGNTYRRGYDKYVWQDPAFGVELIDGLARFDSFKARVKEMWSDFYRDDYPTLSQFIDDFIAKIEKAIVADRNRWSAYGTANAAAATTDFKNRLATKTKWLAKQWGDSRTPEAEAYFINDARWAQVYCWAWDKDNPYINYTGGQWPGEKIDKIGTTASGEFGIYRWRCFGTEPISSNTGIIFGDGGAGEGHQTDDFDFVDGAYYNKSGLADSAVDGITDNHSPMPVYNLMGVKIGMVESLSQAVATLPNGLYIIGTQTVFIHR